ncbi:MAG: LLM class flavin-dependent oxidoreductase [Pseudomonadota bacterium]|nr:LLM class flavin-dependent oxidoreductase [Pseudomonadota bacterium]
MRVGISIATMQLTRDHREGARNIVERARRARESGLDSLFVGDHHVTAAPYYQNSPVMGRLLAEWDDRDCGALYLLPLWNPVIVAEQTATLACIAQGRFILQCALGGEREQSEGMGVSHRHRRTMFEESVDLLRRLWTGETLDHDGHWQLRGARISPVPPGPIDIWIGATADVAIERAARLGDGWLGDPGSVFEATRHQLSVYREACEDHGVDEGAVALRRDVFIGQSATEANRRMEPYLGNYRGFDPKALIIGDVALVAERLNEYKEIGFTDVLMRNISRDQDEALATIERMGRVKEQL